MMQLTVKASTIRTHVERVPAELALRDRIRVVIDAYENGLAPPSGE